MQCMRQTREDAEERRMYDTNHQAKSVLRTRQSAPTQTNQAQSKTSTAILNRRHQQQHSIKDELWHDAAPHVQELSEAHEADKGEHNAEDNANDDIPCDLIVDGDLRRQ